MNTNSYRAPLELAGADLTALPAAFEHFNGFYAQYPNYILPNPIRNLAALAIIALAVLISSCGECVGCYAACVVERTQCQSGSASPAGLASDKGCRKALPLAPAGTVAERGLLHTDITMKVEGLKGCFEKTCGLFYFARMCSKVRLHAQGKLPNDYQDGLGQGFDGRTCRYLAVGYEDVREQVLSGKTDAEVLDWCFANGRRLTEEEILIYNSFISKRGWHDDETEVLAEMITQFGLRDDGKVLTYFDLIEMDEDRWYPDIWRDAWR